MPIERKAPWWFEEYKWYVIPLTFLVSALILIISVYAVYSAYSSKPIEVTQQLVTNIANDDIKAPKTQYVPDDKYFESFHTALNGDQQYVTDENFASDTLGAAVIDSAIFQEQTAVFQHEYTVSDANQELYNIADRYYTVYYGSKRVSPIYPLAVANVETPGRADNSITWSALFPSKYVDINRLYTFNVTDVLNLDDAAYKALTTEWSTRDRGALQMSTTYGTGNKYFNAQMSGDEKSKLATVDTSKHSTWASMASDQPGDRFYVPDVCLRLASANSIAVNNMVDNNYRPKTDLQLICQLAMFHHRSGVWYNKNHNASVGEWKSSEVAYKYSERISQKDITDRLRSYAIEHEDVFNITNDEVEKIFKEVTGESFSSYASNDLVCLYPLKVEYAYIKLCMMYSE